ncbi:MULTISPECIES: sucrase ferredoxin [unclassified Nocardioides]|uniref:sucrase ferredoxin n=1 Tax=unclassified Nocardioides TaxID=2615069 RepID=UPI0009F125DA|nr:MULTISPECIES: sucrase ferredoxin [unclassified Nocardioides]GAW51666.1 sucraseferredoxin family protein [Nocardioides sp. PD653-B2]GAW55366.1 sucraseferredoxin family protein [Nocardioides sp. PD653]
MTAADPAFRCAAASLLRDEPVAGTATHVRTWLVLEHTGPWGNDALLDARLPEGLGAELKKRARTHRAKVLLVRRFSSKPAGAGVRVFAAYADPVRPRIESATLSDPREVLDVDLGALRAGGSSGLAAHDGSLFCVCTNGRHDVCCAEKGRPVAKALDQAHPEETWEVSHIGGDRFAANMVVLPHGLYYGRLDPASAISVAGSHLAGELDLDHLRGRASHPMAVQAAEIFLRRDLGATREDAVLLDRRSAGDGLTSATFTVAGAAYDVVVRSTTDPATATQLTCKALRPNPVPTHELVSVSRRS